MSLPPLPLRTAVLLLACTLVAAAPAPSIAAVPLTQPNIAVILADDFGYGSVGAYGADPQLIRTPNLDRLAREGRRFTEAYTPSSVCTPTRYALVTGRYCWRTSLNHGGVANTLDPLLIETSRPTVASLLKRRGYTTGFVGKWHLGYGTAPRVDYTKELKPGPLELGFDYQFAVPQNHNDITRVFVENHRVFGLRSNNLTPAPGKLGLDAPERDDPKTMGDLTDRAVGWLEKQAGRPAPFFLYFAPVAVHELVTPSAETKGTSKAGPYGDFIHDLDRSVGRVLAALEKQNALENTLIIFTSDNGGVVNPGSKSGASKIAMDAGLKINGALRGGKHDVWEGGFRVPFIVRWPGRVSAGTTSREMIGVVDIFATLAALVGETRLDPTTTAPDSYNVLEAFTGQRERATTPLRPDLILQSASGVYAIRSGPWKWVEGIAATAPGKKKKAAEGPLGDQYKPQLFNLADDPGETRNIAAQHPDVVQRLSALLRAQRARAHSRR
jgi:arylsulfatase A